MTDECLTGASSVSTASKTFSSHGVTSMPNAQTRQSQVNWTLQLLLFKVIVLADMLVCAAHRRYLGIAVIPLRVQTKCEVLADRYQHAVSNGDAPDINEEMSRLTVS